MERFPGKFLLGTVLFAVFLACFSVEIWGQPVSENEVVIGLNVPLTGPYSQQGKDQENTFMLAVKQINDAGGLLGKKIKPILRDTQLNPDVAGKNTIDFIRNHGAVMVTGGSSSSVAVRQSDICQEYGVIFMAAATHSNATTGHMITKAGLTVQKAHRHTFRWFFTAWMTSETLTPFLLERYGPGAEYFYITADYTWGHSLEESMKWGTELKGCDTVGAVRTPVGAKDYKKELMMARKAKPDVLVLILFGNDMINALKQAEDLKLKEEMEIVVPLMEINMAQSVGAKALEGVLSTVQWYWGLRDRFSGTKKYVDAFVSAYGKVPGSVGASGWVAIHEWASAVKRAGSFAPSNVIKAMEGHSFTLLKDKETWREWDHQAVSSVYVVEGKAPNESKGKWDLLKVVSEAKGESVMRNREQNPVILEPLLGETR